MSCPKVDWTGLMRAANGGDAGAYHDLLRHLVPFVRRIVFRDRAKFGAVDPEDIVQDALLALHTHRHTWDETRPLLPWVQAITRNKITDALRRNRFSSIPIDDVVDTLAGRPEGDCSGLDLAKMLAGLKRRQREIVAAISLEGATARQVAERFGMSEGAVRVTLHRSIHALSRTVSGH